MSHQELKDLLPLKALERPDEDEERALAEHLADGCDECEAELTSFRDALGTLALSIDETDGATDRVWRLLEPRLRSEETFHAREHWHLSRLPMVMRVAAAAATVLIVSLGFAVVNLERGLVAADKTTDSEVARLRARVDYLQMGLGSALANISVLKTQLSQTSELTLAAVSPDTHVVHLKGLAPAPNAHAILALSRANKTAFMQVAGLPVAPDNKTYEAWWIGRHTGPIRAGLFEAPAEGTAKVQLTLPPAGEEIVASAITLEPEGGVTQPTGAMYLKGDLPP